MKIRRIFLLLTISIFCFPINVFGTSGLNYSEGDFFTLTIKTELKGKSGAYSGYTETERDTRTYTVVSVSDNQVDMKMTRDWTFSSSDGLEYSEEAGTYFFVFDPNDGAYLYGSYDAPSYYVTRGYYTFDYIWFRIDTEKIIGSTVRILGHEYVIKEQTTTELDLFTDIDVRKVELVGGYAHTTIQDIDYDPDGSFEVTFEDCYYFDINSGYLIKELWHAQCETSVGSFSWNEEVSLTDSSFPLSKNTQATIGRYIPVFVGVTLLVALVIVLYWYRKKRWRNQVEHTLNILSGEYLPPSKPSTYEDGAIIWNPLSLDYQLLLEGSDSPNQKVTFSPGIYVITDTDNRIAVVDIHTDRHLPSHVFQFRDENLRFLYRLALGVIDTDSFVKGVSNIFTSKADTLKQSVHESTGVGEPDSYTRDYFLQTSDPSFPEYSEIAELLARRKVMDYSYGQAPLSPFSHIRKMHKILEFQPQDVFLVGDDDLLCISLARRGINVTLVEIDPYTLALISTISKREKLPITLYQVDLRDPLPSTIQTFDLFAADPDFTIEAFGLFLSRGLSRLNVGGVGLINFENKKGSLFKARYLLELLDVEVVEETRDTWTYVILQNEKVPIRRYYTGKYVHVDYATDIVLKEAPYSSIMFSIRRTETTRIPLPESMGFSGIPTSIYDYDD